MGAIVSLVVQLIKSSAGTSRRMTIGALVVLSLLFGAAYYQVSDNTALWEAMIQILAYANTVYLFLIKPLEE